MSISGNSKSIGLSAILPRSIERYFVYDFEKGCIKAHFGSADHHKIKINVHKAISVDEEMRSLLLAYSDQEDTYHREKDMTYVRSFFKIYFDQILAEAEEEIRLAQLDSSWRSRLQAYLSQVLKRAPFDDQQSIRVQYYKQLRDDGADADKAWSLACEKYPLPDEALNQVPEDTARKLADP